MFHAAIPVGTQIVKADGVGVEFEEVEEFSFEFDILGGVDFAFEDGVLDALAVVEGDFCGSAETSFACFVYG